MSKKSKSLIYLEYTGFRIAKCLLQAMPLRSAVGAGRFLGLLASKVVRRRYRDAVTHLKNAFRDEIDDEKARRIATRVFKNTGATAAEMFLAQRYINDDTFDDFIRFDATEEAQRIFDSGKSFVIISAHFGNWEVAASVLTRILPQNVVSIYRRLDNPLIERDLLEVRARNGVEFVAKEDGWLGILKGIEENKPCGIMIDQAAGTRGLAAEFFGIPCATVASPAVLSLRYSIPIVFALAIRLPGTMQHRGVFFKVPGIERTGDDDEDIKTITQNINDIFEKFVRKMPEQWFWVHRRWKRQGGE
ncbi:MAG: lysophospholipid acyltransferase family protein [Planctomycetes bacterium]|nr:lysophospholipid acyltransferase family protein [Planctomycetota bacterium]